MVLSGNLAATRLSKSLNEIALAITRSLGRRGVHVYRFHPDRSLIDLNSRYCTHVACPNLYDDPAGLTDALIDFAHCQPERPVLFPASDGAVEFIARNEDQIGRYFASVCASWSCVCEIQDKGRLLERALQADVPIPVTYFPKSQAEADHIATTLKYPVVIKPLTSYHWRRPEVTAAIGRVKALVVADAEELTQVYRKVVALAPDLMVQEIVPGETERLLTFLGYIGRDGKVLAGCVRKKIRQYPPGFGYCCLTEMVDDPEIMELSVRLLTRLGYRGIGCVEFKRDPRDGRPKLIEINARAVRTTGVAIGAGVDLPWIAYQEMTAPEPPAPVFTYAVPTRWIHLRTEIRAAWPLIRKRELKLRSWMRLFRGRVVMAVWAWDDLGPSMMDLVLPMYNRLRRLADALLRLVGMRWPHSAKEEA